jgi:hypothetical protein
MTQRSQRYIAARSDERVGFQTTYTSRQEERLTRGAKGREDLSRDVAGERGIKVAVSLQRFTPVSLGLRRCEISALQDESLTMRSGSQKAFTGQEGYGMAENRPKKVGIYERSVGRASGSLATVIGIIVLLIVLVVLAIIIF